ncbi:unnamed protein product [Fraxinus pennsylvanica]|uniref:Methyltransferase FkbM domain-containing protein n=1 Tax=Fraxinus pennsylvanica TaxID=56036 RepID=A0AAD1ZZW3_9LAMI|nr:unnamed protein product [Fraxinus pennsylvanica]
MKNGKRVRGTGRNQAVQSSSNFVSVFDKIQGFDFAVWLKSVEKEGDYVVVKMDAEGIEIHLVPRLVETGANCLIDKMLPGKEESRLSKHICSMLGNKLTQTSDTERMLYNHSPLS